MPTTTPARPPRHTTFSQASRSSTASAAALAGNKRRMMLQTELTKQRAMLLADPRLSLLAPREAEAQPDPLDQAAEELDQDLALRVRVRTFDQLKRIERALQLIQTGEYGRCHRCHEEIPYRRLVVRPDTLYCVPCLTRIEQE